MKRFLTAVGQYLAVTLLVALGLNIFGCADTASVNPVAELASLTVTPGTLQPTFNRSTTQYSVDLTSNIASVTVMAQPAVASDSVSINGQTTTSRTIALNPAGSSTQVSIVVSESGTNSRTYTVLINRAGLAGNNSLRNLTVSSTGGPLTLAPTFDANLLSYTVDVANNVGSIMVTPTPQDPAATVTVDGQPVASGQDQPVQLNGAGSITLVNIVVTAQNSTKKTYLITVSRGISSNANLENLTISPGTLSPFFSAGTVSYTVNVASNVGSVVVTPTLPDTPASMTISVSTVNNGQPTAINSGEARTIPLRNPGLITFVNILVTAENQVSQKNYVVAVVRAALGDDNLSGLTVKLDPSSPNLISFNPNTPDYTVNVGAGDGSLTVSATKAVLTAEMLIESILISPITVPAGTPSSGSVNIPLTGPGTSTIVLISVTAPNGGVPKLYTITVNRALSGNNNLSTLTVALSASDPNLINNFDPSKPSYTVDVASGIFSVTVIAKLQDTNATMEVNGQGTSSGQAREITPLQPPGSPTVITIRVTPPNGIFKDYTVTVNRAPASNSKLSDLTVSSGTGPLILTPDFDPDQLSYTVDAGAMDSVTVFAKKADPNAVMSALGSVIAEAGTQTGQVTISPPLTDVVITVIAQDQISTTPYTITVNRAPP